MKMLLLLSLIVWPAPLVGQSSPQADGGPMSVVGFKWTKSRQVLKMPDTSRVAPAAAMTAADKNFARNRRVNDPAGVRDPNADTIDARSAAMEKAVQEARSPGTKPVDGYAYRVKVRNGSAKVAEVVFWEYRFTESANPSNVARRQFLCGAVVKPGKEKELQAFGLAGPSDVVSVGTLAEKGGGQFAEEVLVNRVEYADGTIWQRAGWNFAEVKAAVARAVSTPWEGESCRGL